MKITNLPSNPELKKPTDQLIREYRGRIARCTSVSDAMDTLDGQDLILSIEAIKQQFPKSANAEFCRLLGY